MNMLQGLFLFGNNFIGTIPDSIGQLDQLLHVRLQKNFLSGPVPTSLGLLPLNELWLNKDKLSGRIPSELGELENIKDLRLNKNKLFGPIPEELFKMKNLVYLDLSKGSLSGTISSSISQLEDLAYFTVNNNKLTGEIPDSFGEMNLQVLLMYGNQLTGEVPQSICANKGSSTGLQQLAVDCLPSATNGTVRVSCDCCDVCCDYESGVCHKV